MKHLLLPLIVVLFIILLRPDAGLSIPDSSTAATQANSPANGLDPVFWIADYQDLRAELLAQRSPLTPWLQQINQAPLEFLCLGETHQDAFRQFLAQAIFPQLRVDVLILEASATEVEKLLSAVTTQDTVPLLGADIAAIIRAVRAKNPQVRIVGVDETEEQVTLRNLEQRNGDRQHLSRDGFIAQTIRTQFQPGRRHVALFGANHCAAYDLGLGNSRPFFRHLMNRLTRRDRMKSALFVASTQTNPLTASLQRANLANEMLVIPNTQAIQPAIYNFRWDLRGFFESYDAFVYFTPNTNYQ
jgi:hypothetical protein